MFKEYDKNTYKEKKIKDRTPFRTSFKKIWSSVWFWRLVAFWFFLNALLFNSALISNAAESDVYVDEEYLQTEFGNYKYYAIVTDGNGNYVTLFTNGKMIANGGTIYSLMSYDDFGFKTMKLEEDYLVVDESGASYSGRSSVTIQLNSLSYGVPSGMNDFLYSNQDIYKVVFSNTGSPSASTEVYYSVANNIGSKPVDDSETGSPDVDVSVDLTEVLTYLEDLNINSDEILVCLNEVILVLKSIFTMLSICIFFLVAEWTANKIRNIVRRFSNYE